MNASTEKGEGKIRGIELFAGGGGLALGLEMAGIDNVAVVEFNRQPPTA